VAHIPACHLRRVGRNGGSPLLDEASVGHLSRKRDPKLLAARPDPPTPWRADAGIEVFTTGDLLDALRDAGHDPDLA
jgi:hypothetical protein